MDIKRMLEINKSRAVELEVNLKDLFNNLNIIKNNFET
jgi:hypothetical protein